MILIDNTVLSNFALVQRPEYIQTAFVEKVGTTENVFAELTKGGDSMTVAGMSMGMAGKCPND